MQIKSRGGSELRRSIGLHHTQPLYERVPTRDDQGRPLADFMMLFPGLRDLTERVLQERIEVLAGVLGQFREVVYVDLNIPLNLLWVSIRQRPGLVLEVSACVKARLPEAVLVGVPPEVLLRRRR